jgi:O-antigen/teichoic acid export membrane protein
LSGGAGVAIVEILNRLVLLALSVVLGRGLGADGLGTYAFAMAVMTLLSLLAMAGMPPLLVREVSAYNVREDWSLMKGFIKRARLVSLIVSTSIAGIGITVVWFFGSPPESVQSQVFFLAFVLLIIEALRKLNSSTLRGLQYIVTGKMLETLVRPLLALIVLFTIFLLFPGLLTPQVAMATQLGAGFLGLLASYILLIRAVPRPLDTVIPEYQTRSWVIGALPFVLLGGVGFLNKQTDILMLGVLTTPEEVGVYRIAVSMSGLTLFGTSIVASVIGPHIARLYERRDKERLQRLATWAARLTLIVSLPVACLLVFFGGAIAGWIYGQEFAEGQMALAILAGADILHSFAGLPQNFLNMMKHESDNLSIFIGFAILNLFLNLILIPQFGIEGAAMATSIAISGRALWLSRRLSLLTGIRSSILGFYGAKA